MNTTNKQPINNSVMIRHKQLTLALLFCSAFAFAQTPQNSGIGTSTPGSKLEIKAATNDAGSSALNVTDSDSKSLLFIRNNGKIGIGTTTPTGWLDVFGGTASTPAMHFLPGVAPSLPSSGDLWYDGTHLYFQKGTSTIDLSAGGSTGTLTSVSLTSANGISGTVTNPTTTPAISLTLGAITPTSVNGNVLTPGTGTLSMRIKG